MSFAQVKPDLKLEVKVDQFSNFCRDLQQKLGQSGTMQQVIDYEVARILEKTVQRTGKADRKKIESWVSRRSTFKIEGKNWRTRDWRTKQEWRVPDSIWGQIVAKRARSLTRKLNKIALAKQSWWLLAQKAGMIIEVPAQVSSAKAEFRDVTGNVGVARERANGNYGLLIENRMPILRFSPPGGLAALFSAIAGRIGFYKRNVKAGVFNDVRQIAQKYPGLTTESAEL